MPATDPLLPRPDEAGRPQVTRHSARRLAADHFGWTGTARELPSYRDRNFRIEAEDGALAVLKIANADEPHAVLEAQNRALEHVGPDMGNAVPRVLRSSSSGDDIVTVGAEGGLRHHVRMVGWIPGTPVAEAGWTPDLLRQAGRLLGRLDQALQTFEHPGTVRELVWDLRGAGGLVARGLADLRDPDGRSLVEACLADFEDRSAPLVPSLPTSVVHNDGNDFNFLVARDDASEPTISGLIDFGDLLTTATVSDLAIAGAYAIFGHPDPVGALGVMAAGYHAARPLHRLEVELLLPLVVMRLCSSVVMSAREAARDPENDYLTISQAHAWTTLAALRLIDPLEAERRLLHSVGLGDGLHVRRRPRETVGALLQGRRDLVGPSLSVSYDEPLHIVRGRGVHLYDAEGRAYLDCVNNVAHVGHQHPRVVDAITRQARVLNTNTRYLHEGLVEYAGRLVDTLPGPLEVCYLVCSGSEANELALRLARAATGGRDMVVLDGGYHGSTGALVDLSPYKYKGAGGAGKPEWVHEVPLPDPYRGRHSGPEAGERYADYVRDAAVEAGSALAGILAEALIGCGGQVVPPAGFLSRAFAHVQDRGGVAIADEVQVGFGRVGSSFWAFEEQGAQADIVTMGKPIGNGHPIGAVVTTRRIADAFANGMEFFSTFGGNPVSCAAALAVLDVIEDEGLQQNAESVGRHLLAGLEELADRHEVIGDVRGVGLYLGVELVADREAKTPHAAAARAAVNRARTAGVLLSTDGPDHNVIKIKPPLPFSRGHADRLIETLDRALRVAD